MCVSSFAHLILIKNRLFGLLLPLLLTIFPISEPKKVCYQGQDTTLLCFIVGDAVQGYVKPSLAHLFSIHHISDLFSGKWARVFMPIITSRM